MNIRNMLKKISFGCGLATLCFTVQASASYCGDPCCPPACCEDGPLTCNAFGVQLKGGVTPTWFADQGHVLVTNPFLVPYVFEGGKSPQFDKIFDLPWQVGAELQWNASTHVQFFAEYAYVNAQGKKRHFFVNDGLFEIHNKHREFQTNGFYLGARYYFGNLWCNECGSSIAPFVGFKGGLVWHNSSRFHSVFTFNDIDYEIGHRDFFKQQTLISAGVQIGLDWSINCNWGVVFTVEAVGTQGLRNNRNIPLNLLTPIGAPAFPTNLSMGETGHLVSVPVTLGVRYTF